MMQAQHISKTYRGRAVLEDVGLTLTPGRNLILGGDNGSGKTTLLHIMMGLRRPDAGRVFWGGRDLRGRRAWRNARQQWGFLPQHPVLPPAATVESLLRFHARLRKTPYGRAYDWLARVGLADEGRKRIESLSGGMRQRLGIALVMFFSPDLIVMDEPASSLDPRWRRELAQWTQEQAERGAAVLVTSQLRESWGDAADYLHCENGRIIADGVTALP
jgi:ABC-2 type transport system ATP-binding protein